MRKIELATGALVDLGTARAYLDTKLPETNRDPALLLLDINNATAVIETLTYGRRLVSRTYSGTKALVVTGDGGGRFVSPQDPVTAVTSIRWQDSATGDLTALSLVGMQIDGSLIYTPNDSAPSGSRVLIECTAGYLAGYNDDHDAALGTLQYVALRVIEIMRQDREKHVGRGISVKTAEGEARFESTTLPPDLRSLIAPFRRFGRA